MTRLYYPTGPGRAFHPLSQAEALRLFHYNHPEGSLHWKEKKVGRYMKPVGAPESPYPRVRVGKHRYYVSRVIFLMHHGWLPDSILHFDGNPYNNQIQNLRVNDGIGSWPLKIPTTLASDTPQYILNGQPLNPGTTPPLSSKTLLGNQAKREKELKS